IETYVGDKLPKTIRGIPIDSIGMRREGSFTAGAKSPFPEIAERIHSSANMGIKIFDYPAELSETGEAIPEIRLNELVAHMAENGVSNTPESQETIRAGKNHDWRYFTIKEYKKLYDRRDQAAED